MKKLPIGIQTFREIRGKGYAYVDKTALVARLAEEGKYYFLARPRRFGKSLLADTLAEAFQGSRELFTGLYLEHHWEWERHHPVVRFDFSRGGLLRSREELDVVVRSQLRRAFRAHGLAPAEETVALQFDELIETLAQRTGEQVVVLIDEYDKPILDNLDEPERARAMREGLRSLYSVLKGQDPHLRFVLLTGVSKFSKVSLFSGLNNLEDITLDPRFATLCGYTQAELENTFAEHLEGVDLAIVREWYNGYNFLGDSVYNPFDVLLFLRTHTLHPYWFETGTPTFLIDLLRRRGFNIPDIERFQARESLLGRFDVDTIEPEALLFQTGYVTIKEHLPGPEGYVAYRMGYPNKEVRMSLPQAVLDGYTPDSGERQRTERAVLDALESDNPQALREALFAFFASIPHDWYRNNRLADYEGYYCSVVYCYFAGLGVDVRAEEPSHRGKVDLCIRYRGRVWLLEFKLSEHGGGAALAQIEARGYHHRFQGQAVTLIGIDFDRQARNISGFEWKRVAA